MDHRIFGISEFHAINPAQTSQTQAKNLFNKGRYLKLPPLARSSNFNQPTVPLRFGAIRVRYGAVAEVIKALPDWVADNREPGYALAEPCANTEISPANRPRSDATSPAKASAA